VAVIENGARPEMRVLRGMLAALPDLIEREQVKSAPRSSSSATSPLASPVILTKVRIGRRFAPCWKRSRGHARDDGDSA
jgi:siroheme synthase